jgi:hypothetical protein
MKQKMYVRGLMGKHRLKWLVLVAGIVGCGDSSEDEAARAAADSAAARDSAMIQRQTEAFTPTAGLPTPKDTSLKAGIVGKPEEGLQVVVEVTETSMKTSHVEVPAGQTTFTLYNRGTQPHTLEISVAHGGRWRTVPAGPGNTAGVTMVLGAGIYEAYCSMKHGGRDHRESGAHTRFVVK